VRPARDVVVYALAVVDAPRRQRVRLYLGASGALKAFVNGVEVLSDPAYHPAQLDQDAVAVTLAPGPNRILLKLCHDEGQLGFFARLADARGDPLRLPAAAWGATLPPLAAEAGAGPAASAVPGVMAALERRARSSGDALAHRDLAIALAERRPGDERERRALGEARRAAELAPRSAAARLLAARLEDDPNRRRHHLEEALRHHPADPRVLAALAGVRAQRGRRVEARRLLERAVAAAPGFVSAQVALADLWEQVGFATRARAAHEALARRYPSHPQAVAAAARSARAGDRLDEAERLLRVALALRHDDAISRASLVQVLVDRGDVEGAARLLDEAIRLAPTDLAARIRLGELLAANGKREEAEAAFAEALRIAPEEAEVFERRGQARLRDGRSHDALHDFNSALALRPQNPQLKELVRAIEPARERYETPYLHDARALAAAAPAPDGEHDAVVLGELRVSRVFPSGLSSSFTQVVVKLLTQRGVDAWRTWSTGYAAGRQEVRVERARVTRPDGSVLETFQESDRSASEPWYRLYYDTRTRGVSFPSLAPGDLVELAVRTDDVAGENLLADYFGELVGLGDRWPKLRADYVLLMPEGRRIHANAPAVAGLVRTERPVAGGLVEHRWTVRDLPAIRPEPGMPGWSEVAPYLHVSTYRGWDEVGRFYWSLVREQLAPTAEIRSLAARLAAEAIAERRERGDPAGGDELAVVQAIHRFVVTNTRYVGLELGIHGFKPYRVDQVLERRFGDCKDKASLTHALLEAVGIDARLVLLRTRRMGRIAEQPASLAVFNHAILYVPRHDLWLDGTAAYSGSHDLPAEDRGATVLVVDPGGAPRFGTVPEGRPEENVTSSRYEVALRPDGSGVVEGETRVMGVHAPSWRRAYAAERERRAQLEQALSHTFPGSAVQEVAVSDLGRLEAEVALRFSLTVPRACDRDGGRVRLLPFGPGQHHAEALAPLSSRRHDLVLGPPGESRLSYRYRLPPGFAVLALPEPVRLDAPFATFETSYRMADGAVLAEARFVTRTSRVAAAEYPAFRELVARADRALAEPVWIEPPPGGGAAR
jgi:tetratricopeptide (TPR) repeat protein